MLTSQYVTFSVQLLQLKYAQYFTYDQRVEIRDLVQKTIDLLGAADVALDEKHGPSLYSRFLAGLLASPAVRVDLTPTSGKSPLISPGVHKRARKPKIAPAKTRGGVVADISTSADYPSPSSVNSGSPSPSYMYSGAEGFSGAQLQDNPTSSELFNGPLPTILDADLLESAQIMTDPLWQDITLVPGTHDTIRIEVLFADCSHRRFPVDESDVIQYLCNPRLFDVRATLWIDGMNVLAILAVLFQCYVVVICGTVVCSCVLLSCIML
jgi:hypothetical protein